MNLHFAQQWLAAFYSYFIAPLVQKSVILSAMCSPTMHCPGLHQTPLQHRFYRMHIVHFIVSYVSYSYLQLCYFYSFSENKPTFIKQKAKIWWVFTVCVTWCCCPVWCSLVQCSLVHCIVGPVMCAIVFFYLLLISCDYLLTMLNSSIIWRPSSGLVPGSDLPRREWCLQQ